MVNVKSDDINDINPRFPQYTPNPIQLSAV